LTIKETLSTGMSISSLTIFTILSEKKKSILGLKW